MMWMNQIFNILGDAGVRSSLNAKELLELPLPLPPLSEQKKIADYLDKKCAEINSIVHVCDSKQDKRFIVYYMQHLAFQGVYKLISDGIRGNTSDFRSWEKVKDIYIAFPLRSEQKEIADYLDKKCAEIESIITDKKIQIETIEKYKKSLIYEYVTGKKEVIDE